jgi:pimeloyl-ACP methyl ester carboxylesterase
MPRAASTTSTTPARRPPPGLLFGGLGCGAGHYTRLIAQLQGGVNGSENEVGAVGAVRVVDWMRHDDARIGRTGTRVVLVGHGWGCQAALQYYARHRARVTAVVLLDYHPFTESPRVQTQASLAALARGFFPRRANTRPAVRDLRAQTHASPAVFAEFGRRFAAQRVAVRVPTLLVEATRRVPSRGRQTMRHECLRREGEVDACLRADDGAATRAAVLLPHASALRLLCADHFWFMDPAGDQHVAVIRAWLHAQ